MRARRRAAGSSFPSRVRSHELGHPERVPLHRRLDVLLLRGGPQLQPGIERVQLEDIAVCGTRRWARSPVAGALEVVAPLTRTTQVESLDLGDVLGQLRGGGRP